MPGAIVIRTGDDLSDSVDSLVRIVTYIDFINPLGFTVVGSRICVKHQILLFPLLKA